MIGWCRRIAPRWLGFGIFVAVVLVLLEAEARAVPSFARQTSLPCAMCHTAFPQLTPFGRQFKLNGYTLSAEQTELPPVAAMLQGAPGFTHTRKAQPEADIPPGFEENNNVSVNQISLFYAGRLLGPYAEKLTGETVGDVLNKVGVFLQGTWDGVGDAWAWDNMEIRAANTLKVGDTDLVVGGYLNNNPTMQDLWNTTPAWGYPFSGSALAPAPAAAPLLAGGLSQQVFGFGAYTMIANQLYIEGGLYHHLSADTQRNLGVDPTGETELDDFAPYWRVAYERSFGEHNVEVGTYGLAAHVFPGTVKSAGHDSITNTGVDIQYQYLTAYHDVTVLVNWLHQSQDLRATQQLGGSTHSSNYLWTASLTGSYLYDKTYGVDIQYFDTQGGRDALLYGTSTGRPGSDGWVFQANWLPLNKLGGPSFWPASNVKFSLQYTLYNQFNGAKKNFDGTGRDATDNDTIFLEAWIAF
ncbi:MAG: cytochrome C [Myxococcota bacterium]